MSDHSKSGRGLLLTSINQALQPKGFQLTTEELNVGEVSPSDSGVRQAMVTVSIANPNGIQKNINGEQVTLVGDKTVHYDFLNLREMFNEAGHQYIVLPEMPVEDIIPAINERYGLGFSEEDVIVIHGPIPTSDNPDADMISFDVANVTAHTDGGPIPEVDSLGREVVAYLQFEENGAALYYKHTVGKMGDSPHPLDGLFVYAPKSTDIFCPIIERIHEVESDDANRRIMFTETGPVLEYLPMGSSEWEAYPVTNPYNLELYVEHARRRVAEEYEETTPGIWYYLENSGDIYNISFFVAPGLVDMDSVHARNVAAAVISDGGDYDFVMNAVEQETKFLLAEGPSFRTMVLHRGELSVAFYGAMPVRIGDTVDNVEDGGLA